MFRSTPAPSCAQKKCTSTFGYRTGPEPRVRAVQTRRQAAVPVAGPRRLRAAHDARKAAPLARPHRAELPLRLHAAADAREPRRLSSYRLSRVLFRKSLSRGVPPWRESRPSLAWTLEPRVTICVRGSSVEASRGDAAAVTWTVRGDESRRRRGCDVDGPWRRVAATPRLRRGDSVSAALRSRRGRRGAVTASLLSTEYPRGILHCDSSKEYLTAAAAGDRRSPQVQIRPG